jgi:hypothetical protein
MRVTLAFPWSLLSREQKQAKREKTAKRRNWNAKRKLWSSKNLKKKLRRRKRSVLG